MTEMFMFATGVENSAPTIEHGRVRVDEMESCGHYEQWTLDFDRVEELGIHFLRYGLPLHRVYLGPDRFEWEFSDKVYADLRRRRIICIADLCHFGLPEWIGNFQNPDFPELFARYAEAFALRFPWIQLYTPLNEMYVCALFSARYGWWNEQLTTDSGFVTALKHIVKANVLAMHAILKVRPNAIFIQSEASEYFHAVDPKAINEGPVGSEAVDWLWKEWANVLRVRNDGIPIVGFTWYSLTDQMDWDTALREKNLRVNPLGLFDLKREIRAVGRAYKKLIADWREVLPTHSVCLRVPIEPQD